MIFFMTLGYFKSNKILKLISLMTYKHEYITVKSSLIKNTFQTQDLKGAFIGVISLRKR
ncbi:hypothetical protein BANRA_01876 [Acinetobacter baumannii]|nr:hypothetical protein BANRA_01876 [Acinetobacter baumannii]